MLATRLLLALAVLALSSPVLARGEECSESAVAWVESWSDEAHIVVESTACPTDRQLMLVTISTPADGAFTMEVLSHAKHAYQVITPDLGASPVANVSDYSEIPLSHRLAFEALCQWLEKHPDRVSFEGAHPEPEMEVFHIESALAPTVTEPPPYSRLTWLGPWLVLLVLVALATALWSGHSYLTGPWWQAASVLLAALVSRAFLGLWGPLHTNFQGASWVEIAFHPIISDWYGPGYPEMFHHLTRHFSATPDIALFAANGLLSALTPLVVLGILRVVRAHPSAAFFGALLLALDPVSARAAASEGYLPLLTSLNLLLLLVVTLGLRGRLEQRAGVAAASFIAAGLLAAHLVRVHPVGWLPMILTIPVAATLVARGWREWLAACAFAGAIIASFAYVSFGDRALFNAALIKFGPGTSYRLDQHVPKWLPWAIGIVTALGASLPWLPGLRSRVRPIVTLTIVALLMLITREQYRHSGLWQLSYDRLFLVPAAVVLFATLPPRQITRWLAPALTGLLLAGSLAWAGWAAFQDDLQTVQYHVTRAVLRETSPDCCLAFPGSWSDSIHGIPHYIASGPVARLPRGFPVTDPRDLEPMRAECGCLYLLRPAMASRADHRGLWEPFDGWPQLRPLLETIVTQPDSNTYSDYVTDEVPIGIYDVVPSP